MKFVWMSYFLVSALFCMSSFAADEGLKKYKIDASHSNVGFTIRHLVSRVNGEFTDVEGDFSFNPKDLKSSRVSATVKAASINTREKKRDDHLKGEDFFSVDKFPQLQFTSTELKSAGKNKYKLIGKMSLHGVTQPVTFDVEYLGESKDPWGMTRVGFVAKSKINRKDYGMVWNKALDNGGVLIGEEVEINLNIEGILQTEKTSG